ncbi:vomeronasal type-1 receptor 2-like [Rhinolophus sinicus]|uniref:vomeronasal type-1 receptor 2-like n=1 Tax=Rhinolophus sinicus TaxID=89399 RepID=UPI003D796AE9
MLVNFIVPMYITGTRESKIPTEKQNLGYCSGIIIDRTLAVISATGSMVLNVIDVRMSYTLTAKNSYQKKCSLRTKPHRASSSVSILVSFYSRPSFFTFYVSHFDKPSWFLMNATLLIAAGFPTLSPSVLSYRDPHVSRFCFAFCSRITHFSKLGMASSSS